MQWQQMDFPILVDTLNVLGLQVVPIISLLNENGGVIKEKVKLEELNQDIDLAPVDSTADPASVFEIPNVETLQQTANSENTSQSWKNVGETIFNYSKDKHSSIQPFEKAVEIDPKDGIAWFRLGAALQWRSESEYAEDNDAQRARGAWGKARELNPNQYIWRRRLQQYGAVRDKPYSLYGWVGEAQKAIISRGDKPFVLRVQLTSSEQATLEEQVNAADSPIDPDPEDRIFRDDKSLIKHQVIVTPEKIASGQTVHVQINLTLNETQKSHWNNEVEPLRLWVRPPDKWQTVPQLITCADPEQPTSLEIRSVEFELTAPDVVADGKITLPCYALYYLCEDIDGTCLFLRKDIDITFEIDHNAIALG